MELIINTFPWTNARGSNESGSRVSHWAKRGKWNWNISSVIYTWGWETCFLIIGTLGLCLNKTPSLGLPLNSVPSVQLSRTLWKRNVAPSLPCKLHRLISNPAIRRGLKSLNQFSVENQLWSRQICLCGKWSWFSCGMLFSPEHFIWGLWQQILEEKPNNFVLHDKQRTRQSCSQPPDSAPAAESSSLAVMSCVLMCSRHSGKLTAPPSPLFFVKTCIWLTV